MSWWAPRNDQITQALASREDMISEDELVALPGAFYGASANTIKKAFPNLIPGSLTDKPWEKGAERRYRRQQYVVGARPHLAAARRVGAELDQRRGRAQRCERDEPDAVGLLLSHEQ